MADQKCPLCGKTAETDLADSDRRITGVACRTCGRYYFTMPAELEIESPDLKQHDKAMLSGVTRERSERDSPITLCSSDYKPEGEPVGVGIAEVLNSMVPRSIPERIDRALLNLAHKTGHLGVRVRVNESDDWPLFFAENSCAMGLTLKHMVESGLLDQVVHWDQGGGEYALTVEGWGRIEELEAKLLPEAGGPTASSDVPATDAEIRQRLLSEFHRMWQGSPRSAVDTIYEVAGRLGLPAEQCLRNAKLLREKGLLECRPTHQGFPDVWSISGNGVEWVERGEQKPQVGDEGQAARGSMDHLPSDDEIARLLDRLESETADQLESDVIEFKRWEDDLKQNLQQATECAVAFANARGGVIVFGISDKIRGRDLALSGCTGCDMHRLRQHIYENTKPSLDCQIADMRLGEKSLIVVRVPPCSRPPCGTAGGLFKIRVGKSNEPLDPTAFW